MCNYGFGTAVSAAGAVEAVTAALDELQVPAEELMISPSGGMWDPGEVPTDALAPIYALAAAAGPQRFFIETRAETVSEERIAQMRAALPGAGLAVEVGLESAFDPVLAYCVNKGSNAAAFIRAADTVRAGGVTMYANVSLGTAFLDRPTAVRDAVNTVRWALDHGADYTVLFPLHIKPYTLLAFLADQDRYQQVSLWDLVEALEELGPDRAARVEIAWYKSYYDTSKKITTSPSGCERCHGRLMTELDRYRATLDFTVIDALSASRCDCAPPPALQQPVTPADDIAAGVIDHYAWLAGALRLQSMWDRWRPRLEPAIHHAFTSYSPQSATSYVG
jgi:radical SAM enzyme (TIGR01210 family)